MRVIAICGPIGMKLSSFVTGLIPTLPCTKKLSCFDEKDYGSSAELVSAIETSTADIVIVSGHELFAEAELRDLLNVKIFLECAQDTCLIQFIQENLAAEEQDVSELLKKYIKFIKPKNDEVINPSKKHADAVIPYGMQPNYAGIYDLLRSHAKYLPFFAKSGVSPVLPGVELPNRTPSGIALA